MASRSFGKTWWGRAWLEALQRIDYDTNRLPRGRSYARGGNVLDIIVEEGEVHAGVKGRRPWPYGVRMKLAEFSNPELKRIREAIESHPAVAYRLTLGELPEELLEILDERGVFLFPEDWDDIEAQCSCPDWANHCKHLAAVYYILASEIDKDPFILFNLRGVPTETLMEAAGLAPGSPDGQDEPGGPSFLPYDQAAARQEGFSLEGLDLSFPDMDLDAIFSLLPDSPLFWSGGDFKKLLRKTYRETGEAAASLETIEGHSWLKGTELYLVYEREGASFFLTAEGGPENLTPVTAQIRTLLNLRSLGRKAALKIPAYGDAGPDLARKSGIRVKPEHAVSLLARLPLDDDIESHTGSLRFFGIAAGVALSLVRSSSFMPELVGETGEDFSIRYVPVIHDPKIEEALGYLRSAMPPGCAFRKEDQAVLGDQGMDDPLSLILSHFIFQSCRAGEIAGGDKITDAFLRGTTYTARKFEERQTRNSVANWLARLSGRKGDITPVIGIDLKGKRDFAIRLEVEDRKDPVSPPASLVRGNLRQGYRLLPAGGVR